MRVVPLPPKNMTTSQGGQAGRKMATATLILMASVLASRVLGLVREALLAARLGTGIEADAYATAFLLPDLVNTLLAGGFLSVSFVPLYAKRLREGGDLAASRFLGGVLLFLGIGGAAVIGGLWIFAEPVLSLMQPGLVGTPSMDRAVDITRILLPAQIAFLLAGAWNGAQYARKSFWAPALAPLVYNVGILLGGVFLAPWLGAEGFAWGVLGGALLGHFSLQWFGSRQAGVTQTWPGQDLGDLKAFLWRTLPLMVGLTLGFSSEFLLRRLSGYLGTGAVAEASYAFRLTMVLVAFFGQAAGVASYPFLVELAGQERWTELQALLRGSMNRLVVALVPASALACALAPELVRFAFQRGAFGPESVDAVADPLRWMVWAVLPWSVQIVLSRGMFARDRFWSSAVLGSVVVLVAWPIWAALVRTYGKAGVGPGLLVLILLQCAVFSTAWFRSPQGREAFQGLVTRMVEALAVSLPAAWAARLVADHLAWPVGPLAGVAVFGALVVPVAWWRRWPGIREVFSRLGSRFRRRPFGTP